MVSIEGYLMDEKMQKREMLEIKNDRIKELEEQLKEANTALDLNEEVLNNKAWTEGVLIKELYILTYDLDEILELLPIELCGEDSRQHAKDIYEEHMQPDVVCG